MLDANTLLSTPLCPLYPLCPCLISVSFHHREALVAFVVLDAVGEADRHELRIRAPRELGRYLAYKGSVVVNGVSLTVNTVSDEADGCVFSINLIPHTVEVTTLNELAPGKRVNLEIDLIARYVERMLSAADGIATPAL